jgi:methionyl-tRNA formyltransferase
VLTQPDRPRGRGQKDAPSPVKELRRQRAIAVCEPRDARERRRAAERLRRALDVLVVAAYGLLLPRAVLDWPPARCINVHASLLPRGGRRADSAGAPCRRHETGVTLMQMDAGLDTGPMLDVARVPSMHADTAGSLECKLATLGAAHAERLSCGALRPAARSADRRNRRPRAYAAKIRKDEADIDWSATRRHRSPGARVRPGARARHALVRLRVKVWRAHGRCTAARAVPRNRDRRIDAGVVVACGAGALAIAECQPAGGKRMSASAFAARSRGGPCARFGAHFSESPSTVCARRRRLAALSVERCWRVRRCRRRSRSSRRRRSRAPGRRRALVSELAYGTLRHWGRLDAHVRSLATKPIADPPLRCLRRGGPLSARAHARAVVRRRRSCGERRGETGASRRQGARQCAPAPLPARARRAGIAP